MKREARLFRRIRWLTVFFIFGLVVSGVTAIPLVSELNLPGGAFGPGHGSLSAPGQWLGRVREALNQTQTQHPFLFYGTDWLAFGHFAIALVFVGAWRDPVRNRWLFDFGLMACLLVLPYAFVFGGLRGIPHGWRLIDCSFGVFGFIPLWFCRSWALELERLGRRQYSDYSRSPARGD
jgi:hypothetical protein